jgi:hypothetical protein
VAFGENFNRIGGTSSGDGNVISGNPQGISLQGNRNLILGNFIGTNISGTQAISNSRGVFMCGNTSHSFVGGATNAERNVISGNGGAGISVEGAERVFILGNYIGTDASGAVALINKMGGIETGSAKRTVIQGNLIGGNRAAGVSIGDGSSFSHLRANRIGVAVDDTSPLPNGSHGVSIWAASNIVGGPYLEDGNIIAFNTGDGVQVWTHPGNTIRRNAIYGNSGSGIHLVNGGNEILAAPIITSVSPSSVSGTAWPGCIVEVFSDEADEGQAYEGYAVADGNGDWTWTGGPNGPYVTATATDGTGNTSPFSAPQLVMCCRLYLPLTLRGED